MNNNSRKIFATTLFSAALSIIPLTSNAQERECEHSAPRDLTLDLNGIKQIQIDVGSSYMNITAAGSQGPSFRGRACATDPAKLPEMTVEQARSGDTLVIKAKSNSTYSMTIFKKVYAFQEFTVQLPAALMLKLNVGSGDVIVDAIDRINADVSSGDLVLKTAQTVSIDVSSGDAMIENIKNGVNASVSSGDLTLRRIGSLNVSSVNSGDLIASQIAGDVLIDRLGSGDISIEQIRGNASVGSIGSGDLELAQIGGNVQIRSIGSGNATVNDIDGNLQVERISSGDIDHSGVKGQVDLPPEDE